MRLRRITFSLSALAGITSLLLPVTAIAAPVGASSDPPPPQFRRVSLTADGAQANGSSKDLVLSGDGRTAVFTSDAADLVSSAAGDGVSQAYARPLRSGKPERVSQSSDGAPGDAPSQNPAVSGDGRYVVFDSASSNLDPRDANSDEDVFVHDRVTGRTSLLTPPPAAAGASGNSGHAAISADGRYVAFQSSREDLVPGDTNGRVDVFVQDRWAHTIKKVSGRQDGSQSVDASSGPTMSADGNLIGFRTGARNVSDRPDPEPESAGPTTYRSHMFAYFNMRTGKLAQAGYTPDGTMAVVLYDDYAFSPDGRYAVYAAAGLIPTSPPEASRASCTLFKRYKTDIYVRDLKTNTVRLITTPVDGTATANSDSVHPRISGDNRTVVFSSKASNLVPGDTNGQSDVFAHDLRTGSTRRISVRPDGGQLTEASYTPVIGWNRTVGFTSDSADLVAGDTNASSDVFAGRLG
ncbi:TolB family protein [Streptomyces albireticuli]|uniref:TolB family protein n=1 Tax=Streptomyces albireticuli TaxID=1940 RepID=UPI000D1B4624|nr:PD40 domain-containing protein [Streptomyces albireticuli]MCD9195867.1 PD40 domain-containing protein [Streptomyces albireticuli]